MKTINELLHTIKQSTQQMSDSLECELPTFLSVVNRWKLTSLLRSEQITPLVSMIKDELNTCFNTQARLIEADVIYKSNYSPHATICHQDIAYAAKNPYHYTTWISLNTVNIDDGAIQCLPGSHQQATAPAIDFWQPYFKDTLRESTAWKKGVKTISTQPGDIILFHSNLWHASTASSSGNERYAIVLRWLLDDVPIKHIPPPKTVTFGMFNCGDKTMQLLNQALQFQGFPAERDYSKLLEQWIKRIELHQLHCPQPINQRHALAALKQVYLLNTAAIKYGAGDSHGIVYKTLWLCLLETLSRTVSPDKKMTRGKHEAPPNSSSLLIS